MLFYTKGKEKFAAGTYGTKIVVLHFLGNYPNGLAYLDAIRFNTIA